MKQTISKKQLREFGLLIGFLFPLLIGFLLPKLSGHVFRLWTLWIGIPGFIIGLTAPRLLYYPYKIWMALGVALGWVNSHFILGLVFFASRASVVVTFFYLFPTRRCSTYLAFCGVREKRVNGLRPTKTNGFS